MSNQHLLDYVREKDYVIVKHGDYLFLHQVSKRPHVKIFTNDINLEHIVGRSYQSLYKLVRTPGKKCAYSAIPVNPDEITQRNAIQLNVQSGLDNRLIDDTNCAQLLSKDEIIGMRDSGQSSGAILSELIKHSTSFSHKTEFAQQKYVKKKYKKYVDYIEIVKPNVRLISKVLLKGADNLGLKMDTLSQIVTGLNFQPHCKYIVYENCSSGLVIAHLLNLLSDRGKLLNVVTSNYPFTKLKAFKAMQFAESKLKLLVHVESHLFVKYSQLADDAEENELVPDDGDGGGGEDPNTLKRKNTSSESFPSKRLQRLETQNEEVKKLLEEKADGLLFACKEISSKGLKTMLQYLAPSRPFVIYSQYKEPLIKLFSELKQRRDVTCIRLFENQTRIYQVLENRTHPENMMNATNGFLLSGITVDNP